MGSIYGSYNCNSFIINTLRIINWANTLIMRHYSDKSIFTMIKAFKPEGVLDYLQHRGFKEDIKYLQENYFKIYD